jgi:hypothetical protein
VPSAPPTNSKASKSTSQNKVAKKSPQVTILPGDTLSLFDKDVSGLATTTGWYVN